MGKKKAANGKRNGNGNGANLGFEHKLWLAADEDFVAVHGWPAR